MRKLRNEELTRLNTEEYKNAQKNNITLVLDQVRSLNNVGSAFRTADAFLIERIMLCGLTGTPPNKEIEKTALGATETVPWEYHKTTEEALEKLKKNGYQIFAVEQVDKSIMLHNFNLPANQKTALVFGHEVYGVSQDVINLCNGCIEIPQLGSKHSLNISVSIGIVLWEIMRNKF